MKIENALETGMTNLASVILHDLKKDIQNLPGSGAAGGLGAMTLQPVMR